MYFKDLKCSVSAQRAMAKFVMLEIHLEQTTDGQAKIETRQTERIMENTRKAR